MAVSRPALALLLRGPWLTKQPTPITRRRAHKVKVFSTVPSVRIASEKHTAGQAVPLVENEPVIEPEPHTLIAAEQPTALKIRLHPRPEFKGQRVQAQIRRRDETWSRIAAHVRQQPPSASCPSELVILIPAPVTQPPPRQQGQGGLWDYLPIERKSLPRPHRCVRQL